MSQAPETTVIMPCFNVEKYVKRAVYSVLDQTVANLELIVVDDGSTDNTYQELLTIPDKRLKILRMPRNQGISAALNLGLKHVRGKYLASIAGDDRWVPNKLERQMKFLTENNLDAVISWAREEADAESPLTQAVINKFKINSNALTFFLTSPHVGIGSTIFGKSEAALEQLDEKLQTNEDWEYFARLSIRGVKFGILPETLTICTRRSEGLSKIKSTAQQAQLAIEKFKFKVSDYILAQSYIRSALWMINPEKPRWFDALTLTQKAIETDWKIMFSKNFLVLAKFLITNYILRACSREKKYS